MIAFNATHSLNPISHQHRGSSKAGILKVNMGPFHLRNASVRKKKYSAQTFDTDGRNVMSVQVEMLQN